MFNPRRQRGAFSAALVSAGVLFLSHPVGAGPLQAEQQAWGTLSTPRFRIVYTPKAQGAARALATRIEETRDDFQHLLGRDWPGVTEIRIGVGRKELEALALGGAKPPAWATALAYPSENVILLDALTLSGLSAQTTLRHELSHVALGRLGDAWPKWFQEGMAMYLTGDRFSPAQYAALFRALTQDRVFHFEDLVDKWPDDPLDVSIAYAQSVAFVDYLMQHHERTELHSLLDAVATGEAFETAFAKAFRASLNTEEQAWRRQLSNRYSWLPIITGASVQWAALALICIFAFLRRRSQRAQRLAEMDEEPWDEPAGPDLVLGPKADSQSESTRPLEPPAPP